MKINEENLYLLQKVILEELKRNMRNFDLNCFMTSLVARDVINKLSDESIEVEILFVNYIVKRKQIIML